MHDASMQSFYARSASSISNAQSGVHRIMLVPLAAIVLAAVNTYSFGAGPAPLPSGGQFVAGAGSMTRNETTLAIKQTTPNAVIDWKSFSIDKSHTVSIDNPNGATLNRVTGPSIATIDGKLTGIGDVYLIDPHGVLVGRTGIVSTGGRFVASTLNVTNENFMQYFPNLVLNGKSEGQIVNLGKIESSGSDVILIASNKVVNAGEMRADKGLTQLAVGQNVLIPLFERLGYSAYIQVGSAGTVVNAGVMRAAQIELEAADGNVFALAGHHAELRATGTADRDGHVWLAADRGKVDAHGGTIVAQNSGGSPGEVDMTADRLDVGDVTVRAGLWSITVPELTIHRALGQSFSRSLSLGTAVNVDTASPSRRSGDIVVSGNVRWTGAAPLYFRTGHSVTIAPGVTVANTGGATFTMAVDALAASNGGSVVNYGTFDWCRSTGIVAMYYDRNGRYVPGVQHVNPSWQPAHLSGLKTQITSYQLINNFDDFNAIKDNLAGNYMVNPGAVFRDTYVLPTPIGNAAHPFTGQFDGGGNIFSLAINVSNTDANSDTGFFGVIGRNGLVRSFGLINGKASADQGALGMIAGRNDGLVIDVDAYGDVTGGSTATGGVVGVNRGVVALSQSEFTTVTGGAASGGVVGVNAGTILRAEAGSAVTSRSGPVGGIAGVNRGTIYQAYYASQITPPVVSGNEAVGGLAGANAGLISQSFTNAVTTTTASGAPVGGVAGVNVGKIAPYVYWNKDSGHATKGVGQGINIPATSGLTTASLADPSSYGPTWDFSSHGIWQSPELYGYPVFH